MDRVKQFLMARPLLERRPPAEASTSRPAVASAPAASNDGAGHTAPAAPRDRRRDLLLMLMLLRTFGRRT